MTTINTTDLNGPAPYPRCEEDATPEAMARNALVASWVNSVLASAALRDPRPEMDRLAAMFHEAATEQFDVATLLGELATAAPERAAEVARDMWRQRQDGVVIHELTWERLTAADINPDEVASVAEANWRASAERRAA